MSRYLTPRQFFAKKYWDPNFSTAPLTYSAGGLMMTC